MDYHKVVNQILEILKENNAWFETFEHEPARTSEESAKLRPGYTISQGAKAIIVRVKNISGEKKYVMLVIPGNLRFDNEKTKQALNVKDIRFATEEEVLEITNGVLPGGVPPFGNLFGLEVFVDPILLENERIVFNAGDKKFSVAIKSEDYKNVVNPSVLSIT